MSEGYGSAALVREDKDHKSCPPLLFLCLLKGKQRRQDQQAFKSES